jgi:hypothetical protein
MKKECLQCRIMLESFKSGEIAVDSEATMALEVETFQRFIIFQHGDHIEVKSGERRAPVYDTDLQ